MLFGKRLKEARERTGVSQRQLGFRIGLDPSGASTRINRYERGTRAPAFEIVRNIAMELRVPPSFFYEPDDSFAELILLLGRMDVARREALLEKLRMGLDV